MLLIMYCMLQLLHQSAVDSVEKNRIKVIILYGRSDVNNIGIKTRLPSLPRHGRRGRPALSRDPRVSRSDEFPESILVVNAVPVAVDHKADGMVHFGLGNR